MPRSSLCGLVVASLILATAWSTACAAEPDYAALQSAVVASAEAYEKAFAARDAKALVALFTPEAEYVGSGGTVFHGREAIQAEMESSFAVEPPGTVSIEILSIRPVADGVLVEDGVSEFTPKAAGPSSMTRYSATHVRQKDGTWRIASVRELEPALLTPHARLMDLAWLVGEWREEIDGHVVETTWKWSEDGNFLISEFAARRSSEVLMKGTHRVGWDAGRRQFRSWVFESNGGAAEGWWERNEAGIWAVRVNGTDDDGNAVAATLTYQRDGDDALLVTQEHRSRGGVALPADAHRVVRKPPAAGTSAKGPAAQAATTK